MSTRASASPNVYLVGMMGAGKTTVGRLLARRLKLRFIDSDHEIESRCGVKIPLIFEIDPELSEAVEVYRPVSKLRWGTDWAVVTRFPTRRPLRDMAGTWRYRHRLAISHYAMDVRLTPTGSADLDFVARATLTLTAQEPIGPWLRFSLHPKLQLEPSAGCRCRKTLLP